MKVTPGNSPTLPPGKKVDKQSVAKGDFDSASGDGLSPEMLSEKSDFANVLARVTRSHKEMSTSSAERRTDHPSEARAKSRDEDTVENETPVVAADTVLKREPTVATEASPDARAILHNVDLDSIVAACRVQFAADGRQQVVLDLSRSVLEGLRVKVSADATGRITADFMAANDGIKALLDSRSRELIDLLRSRGINLAEFRSSVGTDTNTGSNSRSFGNAAAQVERIDARTRTAEAVLPVDESESLEGTDELANGATYRA